MKKNWPSFETTPNKAKRVKGKQHDRTLFVGGLAFHTTDESLRAHFEKFGTIEEAEVKKNTKNRRSRGFAFVTYTQSSMKENALRSSPHLLDGSFVGVREAYHRPKVDPEVKEMLWLQRRRHQRQNSTWSDEHGRKIPKSVATKLQRLKAKASASQHYGGSYRKSSSSVSASASGIEGGDRSSQQSSTSSAIHGGHNHQRGGAAEESHFALADVAEKSYQSTNNNYSNNNNYQKSNHTTQ
nr:heterogeneous nuclear ribonucleoprotein A1-like [Drosophila takahashii]